MCVWGAPHCNGKIFKPTTQTHTHTHTRPPFNRRCLSLSLHVHACSVLPDAASLASQGISHGDLLFLGYDMERQVGRAVWLVAWVGGLVVVA